MTSISALLLRTCSPVLVACVCGLSAAQDRPELDLDLAIERLSSRRFEVRQLAFDRLVLAGSHAIAAVESSAGEYDLEHARRCVEVLAKIAQDKATHEAALESLDRLGNEAFFPGSSLAKKRSFQLRETKAERAIRLLTSAGVRLTQSSSHGVRYVSGIYRDREVVHLQHLTSLKMVTLSGLEVTDNCFAHLAKVPQLESVTFMRCSVTDAGLAQLPKLTKLTRIGLLGESVSAAGLKHLGEVPNLSSIAIFTPVGCDELRVLSNLSVRSLYLSEVEMSAEVSEILSSLRGLGSLHVSIKGVTNDDLRWVKRTKLPSLDLSISDSPDVTDNGLLHLRASGLRTLQLRRTGITDQGLATVAGIKSLTSFSVYDSPITDEGVKQLASLDQLRTLSLQGTKVSDETLKSLQELMPKLRYVRNKQAAGLPVPVRPPAPPIKTIPPGQARLQ